MSPYMTDSTDNTLNSAPAATPAEDANQKTAPANLEEATVDPKEELNQLLDSSLTTDEKFAALHLQFSTLLTRLEKSDKLVERLRENMYYGGFSVYDEDEVHEDMEGDVPPESFTSTMPPLEEEDPEKEANPISATPITGGNQEPEGFGPKSTYQTTPEEDEEEKQSDTPQGRIMALWQHLEELRWVLMKSIAILVIATGLGIYLSSFIYDIIMHPVQKQVDAGTVQVFYQAPTAAFMVKLKMALLAGIFLALPFMLGFIWQFISPGLKDRERNYLLYAQLIGVGCFILGGAFGYSFLPLGIPVLIEFGDPSVQQFWPLGEYISFCVKLILAFGVVFEMPVVLGTLVRLGVVRSATLANARPYAIITILVVAALLTPPDVFSQLALGIPMAVLYEISIIVGRWQERKIKAREELEKKEEEES